MWLSEINVPPCIYGGQHPYSSCINFLRIWTSKNNPKITGRFYLEYLYESRGIKIILFIYCTILGLQVTSSLSCLMIGNKRFPISFFSLIFCFVWRTTRPKHLNNGAPRIINARNCCFGQYITLVQAI